jgi:hypothetical protein
METFTLFVLLAANICGPIPPIAQSHACGMPRPAVENLTSDECFEARRAFLKKEPGARAHCVRDERPDPFVIKPNPR